MGKTTKAGRKAKTFIPDKNKIKKAKKELSKFYKNNITINYNYKKVFMLKTYVFEYSLFSDKIKNSSNFIIDFNRLIKDLEMSEFELSAFTLLIDNYIKIKENKYFVLISNFWQELRFLGFYIKIKMSPKDISKINKEINKQYSHFDIHYLKWLSDNNDIIEQIYASLKIDTVNERNKKLSTMFHPFCKLHIDYGGMTDKLISICPEYLKHKKDEEQKSKNNHSRAALTKSDSPPNKNNKNFNADCHSVEEQSKNFIKLNNNPENYDIEEGDNKNSELKNEFNYSNLKIYEGTNPKELEDFFP